MGVLFSLTLLCIPSKCHVRLCCMIVFYDVAMLVCPPVALNHALLCVYVRIVSSCMRCILVPSFCNGKSKGPYHLFKCIHGVLYCQMLQVRRNNFPGSRVCKIHLYHTPHKHLFMTLQWTYHSHVFRSSYSCIAFA